MRTVSRRRIGTSRPRDILSQGEGSPPAAPRGILRAPVDRGGPPERTTMRYDEIETPVGPLLVAADDAGLRRIHFSPAGSRSRRIPPGRATPLPSGLSPGSSPSTSPGSAGPSTCRSRRRARPSSSRPGGPSPRSPTGRRSPTRSWPGGSGGPPRRGRWARRTVATRCRSSSPATGSSARTARSPASAAGSERSAPSSSSRAPPASPPGDSSD